MVHTRNTPVMKPLAASVVISSGGSMSARWLEGGGIVQLVSVSTGAAPISIDLLIG